MTSSFPHLAPEALPLLAPAGEPSPLAGGPGVPPPFAALLAQAKGPVALAGAERGPAQALPVEPARLAGSWVDVSPENPPADDLDQEVLRIQQETLAGLLLPAPTPATVDPAEVNPAAADAASPQRETPARPEAAPSGSSWPASSEPGPANPRPTGARFDRPRPQPQPLASETAPPATDPGETRPAFAGRKPGETWGASARGPIMPAPLAPSVDAARRFLPPAESEAPLLPAAAPGRPAEASAEALSGARAPAAVGAPAEGASADTRTPRLRPLPEARTGEPPAPEAAVASWRAPRLWTSAPSPRVSPSPDILPRTEPPAPVLASGSAPLSPSAPRSDFAPSLYPTEGSPLSPAPRLAPEPAATRAMPAGASAALLAGGESELESGSPTDAAAALPPPPPAPAARLEKFADRRLQEIPPPVPNGAESGKKFNLPIDKEILVNSGEQVGIEDAKGESAMPTTSHPLPSLAPRAPEGWPGVEAAALASRSVSSEPLSSRPLPAANPTEAVRAVVDLAEVARSREPSSVEVKFEFSPEQHVAVRVEYRQGEVHTTFRTDSAELREVLAREWQQQMVGNAEPRAFRLVEAAFTPAKADEGASASPSGHDAFRRGGQQEAEPAVPAARLSVASQTGGRGSAESAPPAPVRRLVSTSQHLNVFA